MDNTDRLLEEIIVLLGTLIDKTDHTNNILKQGVRTQFGHGLHTLEMDPDRFQKSEEERNRPRNPGIKNA